MAFYDSQLLFLAWKLLNLCAPSADLNGHVLHTHMRSRMYYTYLINKTHISLH